MAILDDVKISLRISHNQLDDDISATIIAAEKDLKIAGVVTMSETDALTVQAIKLYCRSWYNFGGQSERWEKAYTALKQSMSLCGDYNEAIT